MPSGVGSSAQSVTRRATVASPCRICVPWSGGLYDLALNGASVRALMMSNNSVTPHRLVVGQENMLLNGTKLVAVSASTR